MDDMENLSSILNKLPIALKAMLSTKGIKLLDCVFFTQLDKMQIFVVHHEQILHEFKCTNLSELSEIRQMLQTIITEELKDIEGSVPAFVVPHENKDEYRMQQVLPNLAGVYISEAFLQKYNSVLGDYMTLMAQLGHLIKKEENENF